MVIGIIIAVIIYILYASGKGMSTQQTTKNKKLQKLIEEQSFQNLPKNIQVKVTSSPISYNNYSTDNLNVLKKIEIAATPLVSINNSEDNSIIDVTDQSYTINSSTDLQTYSDGVPKWVHQYVYSYTEINSASSEQKKFYAVFKNCFLAGKYLELEGNTNYAFILLFDLLKDYEDHQNIDKLEKQLKVLGQFYPKTKSYGVSFLIQKMSAKGDNQSAYRLREEQRSDYYDYWKLGSKYKTKLKLNDDQVKLANKLLNPGNNFCNLEFCLIEVIKLFFNAIEELENKYKQEGTTIDEVFLSVADIIARKQFRYKNGTQNYKYCIETTTTEFYNHIFKHCENAVREYYGHKRKIATDVNYTSTEAKNDFATKIISKVTESLPHLVLKVQQPNEPTDIELYAQNTSRWKIKFEELTTNYKAPKDFIDLVVRLGDLNKKNPSVENIFFEASKFMAKHDKETALSLYVYYLYHDLNSATFDNRQFAKTIQKSLFKTPEQFNDFEKIVADLINTKNLENALRSIPKIYEIKRKKIQLDVASIKEVQQQHSGTVELLNEYLKDDNDDESNTVKWQEQKNEQIEIEIPQKDVKHHLTYTNVIAFTPMHISTLDFFAKSNFSISQSEIEAFAKSNGLFKNQLIESINDVCYEFLDDLLIEEEEEYYIINANYYQRIYIQND